MSTGNDPSEVTALENSPGTAAAPPVTGLRKSRIRATVRVILGIAFFVLGIVGTLLPVIQGWLFFALSLIMFFPNHPKVDALLRRAEPRAPRAVRWMRRLGFGIDDLEGISRIDVRELVHRHPHHHHHLEDP